MIPYNRTTYGDVRSPGNLYYNASSNTYTQNPPTVYATGIIKTNQQGNQSSVSTLGFRSKKRSSLPDNPYSKGVGDLSYDVMTLHLFQQWSSGDTNTDSFIAPSKHFGADAEDNVPWSDDSFAKAVSKILSDISLTKGSLAVTAAEFPKTASHIAKTATRLFEAYRGLRRGRLGELTDALGITVSSKQIKRFNRRKVKYLKTDGNLRNFAASTWLEYTYGWKPLVSDIFTQAENLANYLTERQNVVRSARKSATTEVDKTLYPSTLGFPGRVTKRLRIKRKTTVVVKYKIDGQPSLLDQFGITNPALVAWELVPFSFVVDWILPVGNFIESLTATNGLLFHSGTVAYVDDISITTVVTADGLIHGTNPATTWSGSGGGSNTKRIKNRSVLSTFPSVQIPSLKDPSSFAHLASALSLLQSIFGKK